MKVNKIKYDMYKYIDAEEINYFNAMSVSEFTLNKVDLLDLDFYISDKIKRKPVRIDVINDPESGELILPGLDRKEPRCGGISIILNFDFDDDYITIYPDEIKGYMRDNKIDNLLK